MKGLDIAFSMPSQQWWDDRREEGFEAMVQNVWTGGFASNDGIKAVAETNLRRARRAGYRRGLYANASPPDWWSIKIQMDNIKLNAGREWESVPDVAVDVEIPRTTMDRVMELADALEAAGKTADVLYTARWFWSGHMGNSINPRWLRFDLWSAHYDWNPDIDFQNSSYGPWILSDLVGEQFRGTTYINERDGKRQAVDLNNFISYWPRAPRPEPDPTPEPEPEGEKIVGKILDAAKAAANALVKGAQLTEGELAKAKLLPAPIAGPQGPKGDPGGTEPAPAPSPAPTGTTHTVKSGDTLGDIALKFGDRWPAGMELWGDNGAVEVLAAHNGMDPNAGLTIGHVLKIPW